MSDLNSCHFGNIQTATNINLYMNAHLYVFEIVALISSYMKMFSAKPCCFPDVKETMEFLLLNSSLPFDKLIECLESLLNWNKEQLVIVYSEIKQLLNEITSSNDLRNRLIELTYRFNSYSYFYCFCEYQLSKKLKSNRSYFSSDDFSFIENLFIYYFKLKPLLSGGIGGEREVQPCDEFLRLASFYHRNQPSQNSISNLLSQNYSFILNSCHISQIGISTSVHNYVFNLEIIDSLRSIGAAEPALHAFERMGVKHIQLDSMSYLIIPVLMECGLFFEASKHYSSIVNFHSHANKETHDMIAKSYQFNNYMKAFELADFGSRCKRSIHLAVAKIELPLLRLVEKVHQYHEAEIYLQEYYIGTSQVRFGIYV